MHAQRCHSLRDLRCAMQGALVLAAITLPRAPASGASPRVDRFTLDCGIRVVVLHVPASEHVSIFSYLPMGLANDGPGQAQWSHLVEHLVLRSTVPVGTQNANAETLPDHMRLDFYGTTEDWRRGLSHHAKWLRGEPLPEKSLAVEKESVIAECDAVARRLAAHKFALAAWAQGFRHGRNHAALKGDVRNATLAALRQYRDRHLVVPRQVVICVVGGVEVRAVRKAMEKEMAGLVAPGKPHNPVKTHAGNRDMTWDLDARHLVLTWPIPRFTARDYSALVVGAQVLAMRLFADPQLKKQTGFVVAGTDLTTPEGTFLFVSASLRSGSSFDDVRRAILAHVEALPSDPSTRAQIPLVAGQLAASFRAPQDPALAKAHAPPNVSPAMIEGNIGVQWGMAEFRYGSGRAALARRLAPITATDVQQTFRRHITDARRTTLTLHPEKAP